MSNPTTFPVNGYAASELDIREPLAAVGDDDYALLAAWNGRTITVFDPPFADTLADQASELANRIDLQLHEGEAPAEERRPLFAACKGLWTLARKLREHAQQARD